MIPAELKGGLIGKAGVEIQKITQATKCSISMTQSNPADPFVALQLTGNTAAAEVMINERIAVLQKEKAESAPPWMKPDKNQWLIEKLTAEGTAPERIAQLMAVMASKRTGGDWTCPACQSNVFASKSACFKCNTPRPAAVK